MKLPREFYAQDSLEVARQLLGKVLVRKWNGKRLAGRIVETEAYLGPTDVASHARHGPASKAAPMFGEPGHAYIYFTYGMHYCLNCVTEPVGSGTAVLLRALEPLEGIDVMRKFRQARNPERQLPEVQLTNGPGKMCQALALDTATNGTDLLGNKLWIEDSPALPDAGVERSARVGIARGREHQWRFYIKDSTHISKHPKY
jgi:DNA-3-methyladenine glycosylase